MDSAHHELPEHFTIFAESLLTQHPSTLEHDLAGCHPDRGHMDVQGADFAEVASPILLSLTAVGPSRLSRVVSLAWPGR